MSARPSPLSPNVVTATSSRLGARARAMSHSFRSADRATYRKVVLVCLLFCSVFVAVAFLARPQPETGYALKKADRLTKTAGEARPAN